MNDLTAVDVLLTPDESMIALAKRVNARMLTSVPPPTGFALDEHHQPHITTLQRYVRTADLDQVYAAIDDVLASVDLSTLKLTAQRLAHIAVEPPVGLVAIVIKPGPEVLDFQARLIDALLPYCGSGGTEDAYVRTDAEPSINAPTLTYIENYVPEHSGENYLAHVTVGLATLDDLGTLEAEPFDPLTFSASGVSIYQLGNNGTAARALKSWRP
ncbi:hypothetical protein ACIGBL_30405 [Streptomyces sp. NPDC085614]|uniref:hypothetical protein n=1 Tax=Streptomyces sp. NPDC085614 TaxID=3365733 RepID=UPI0037D4D3B3